MAWSDSHEEMTWVEKHGILLRTKTDELEEGVERLEMRIEFVLQELGLDPAPDHSLEASDLDI